MNRLLSPYSVAIGLLGAAAVAMTGCGSSGDNGDNGGGNNADGGGGNNLDGGGSEGGHHPGDPGGPDAGPVATCSGDSKDAPGGALDFANNLIPSPAPPGNLSPDNAPQIVVFGWDDVESQAGITFVNSLLGSLSNPDSTKGSCNLNPNSCYAEGWSAPAGKYVCGDGTLANARGDVTVNKFDIGNHTVDHLESNSTWSGIPAAYQDPTTKGWKFTDDGFGPGIAMDQQTWQDVLNANDTELKSLLGVTKIAGFRGPRLEVNDNGLLALKAIGYQYDETLEEILPTGYVDAAVAVNTDGKKGFNWVPWPYTLDNGSPGIWNQQAGGDKKFITNYPTGVWEIPVYQAYIPAADGKTIADAMLKSDDPSNCTFPDGTPADQQKHCYLGDGELSPGDTVKEVSAFDFNTFIYSRMTKDQWLNAMKHTFLMRYYGNRAPLTYGAHPVEYTEPYDSYTLAVQGNNYGYRDVVKYNKYTDRQAAMQEFVAWVKGDPALSKDTYFMSAQQLVDYMQNPIDKTGKKVAADAVASPDSNGIFTRLAWSGSGATLKAVDGNSADITFNVASVDNAVSVGTNINAGSLKGVSHIDVQYNTEVPFRVRLLTIDGSVATTVLLAGVGGDRTARIRIKDFFPDPDATAGDVASAPLVDAAYMAKVNGIAFESAATPVTGAKAFATHIKQITFHGVSTADLCTK